MAQAKSQGNVTQIKPFGNKGLVQRVDANQLREDQYAFLLNMVSSQEGSIRPRTGYTALSTSWGTQPAFSHTMGVARANGPQGDLYAYLGTGTEIRRNKYTGFSGSSTVIEGNAVTSSRRGTYIPWKNDKAGSQIMTYFATGEKMLRDNGGYGDARVWGIDPPLDFCKAQPGTYSFVDIITDGTFNGSFSLTDARLNDTIASVAAVVANTSADGYYAITPTGGSTTINAILPGMYLKVDTMDIFVDKVDAVLGVFYAFFPLLPSAGDTIKAYETADITSTPPAVSDETSNAITSNLAFNGSAEDGFETDDNIHVSIFVGTPDTVADIRLRLQVGGSTSDFYEKSLLPSPAQSVVGGATSVTDTSTAATALNEYGRYQSTNVYGQIEDTRIQDGLEVNPYIPPPDNINSGLQPASIAPANAGTWNEFTISKKGFLKVGRAGMGGYTWADVTAVQLVVKPTSDTAVATVKLGSVFAYGGEGLNSDRSQALQPYDYVYTYIDPETQAESNPCPFMAPSSRVRVGRQSIKVQVRGTDDTAGQYQGIKRIAIYRRGGAFTDGLFRLVGYVDNPGSPGTAMFDDSVDDISIISAKIAAFDNYPPALVDIPVLIECPISSVSYGSDYAVVNLTLPAYFSDIRPYVTPGTRITLRSSDASSDTDFSTFADAVGSTGLSFYIQREPVVGDKIVVSSMNRGGCDVGCAAFERVWLSGNSLSPHVVYSSKTGRPESFPIINEATLNAHSVSVSSPDNPVNGLVEFNGEVIALCQNGLYSIRLDQGRIVGPQELPSTRGLYTKGAFCKVDNEIWFLAYDGIYSWSGNTVTKKTLAIDQLFNGIAINGISPIDFSSNFGSIPAISYFCMQQKGNEVWMNYLNQDGYFQTLRYHLIFDRWSIEEYYDSTSTVTVDRNGHTLPLCSITALATDSVLGVLIASITTTQSGGTVAELAFIDYQAAGGIILGDFDNSDSLSGTPIYYQAITKAFDLDTPMQQKNFTDIALELTIGNSADTFGIKAYYDYSSTASTQDSFTLSPTLTGRQIFQLPLGAGSTPEASFGSAGRVVQWEVYGLSTSVDNAWHTMSMTYIDLADLQKGRIMDWSDLGHPFDKRMNTVTIEYDVAGSLVDLYLDYIYSKDGDTTLLGAQTITLGEGVGSGRAKQTFAINDGIVAKLVRLRPVISTAQYQIFGTPDWNFTPYPADIVKFTDYSDYGHQYEKRFYVLYINVDTNGEDVTVDIEGDGDVKQTITVSGTAANRMVSKAVSIDVIAKLVRLNVKNIPTGGKFQLFDHSFEKENFPPEIVLSTPWSDHGYDYDKYFEQLAFDVNTNGKNVPVQLWGDGVLKQTVTVNCTQSTRGRNITLNPSIRAKTIRLVVDPSAIPPDGRFQLWGYNPIFQPADKGPVGHTFDWTDVGHPYDKKFVEMTFEYETLSDNVGVAIDTLTGINGNIETLGAKTFTIQAAGRGKAVVSMLANSGAEIIAKMVRVRGLGTNDTLVNNPDFKMWNVQFPGVIAYPADTTPFTEWSDGGYACRKAMRGVGLEINTNGVDGVVHLDVDGVASVKSWTINTDVNDRRVFLTADFEPEILGKLFRLRFIPGSGGAMQLFGNPNWDLVKDACEFVFFDTFEQAFGSAGYTVIWQQWLDYRCDGSIEIRFYNDNGTLFYSKQLPPHLTRYPERFYLPSQYGGVNNKSKKHRIIIEALDYSKPFYLYRDESRTECYNLSADQRAGFYQNIIWQDIKIQV